MKKVFREQIDNIVGLPPFNINFSNHNVYGIDFVVDSVDEYEALLHTLTNSKLAEAERGARIYAEETMAKSKEPYTGASKIKFMRKCIHGAIVRNETEYGERLWDFFDTLDISNDVNLCAIIYYKDRGLSREFYLEVFTTSIDVASQIAGHLKMKDDINGVTIYRVAQQIYETSSEMLEQ